MGLNLTTGVSTSLEKAMARKSSVITTNAESDVELAGRAVSGQAAFDELYRRHADAAWRVAYAVTGRRDDAADAVADAFARMLKGLSDGGLADPDRLQAYLLATTRSAAIDVLRRSGKVLPTGDELAENRRPAVAGAPDHLPGGMDAAIMVSAFRSLPERWRSALWLTEVEEMTPSEAAPLLGMTPDGVAQLALRARAGLRQRFLQAQLRGVGAPCRWTVKRLGAFVGGGLPSHDADLVERHLDGCSQCQSRLSELETGSSLRKVAAALPPALGGLVGDHWRKEAGARPRRPIVSEGTQRGLMGASLSLLAIGILGASVVGRPAVGSLGPARAASAGPSDRTPVGRTQWSASGSALGGSLPIYAADGSTPWSRASGQTAAVVGKVGPSPGLSATGTTPTSAAGASAAPTAGAAGTPTMQFNGTLSLSPAPVDAALVAGTSALGVAATTPSGPQSVAVQGPAPTAPPANSGNSPTASGSLATPAGTASLTLPPSGPASSSLSGS